LTWSAAVKITGGAAEAKHLLADGLVIDSGHISHLVIASPTNAPGSTPFEIYHVAIDSADTINARGLITDQVFVSREPNVGYPKLRSSNQELLIVFKSVFGGPLFGAAVARAPVGITPAWTIEAVNNADANGPLNDDFSCPSLAVDDSGFPHVFWMQNPNGANVAPGTLLLTSQGGDVGTGWTVPTVLFTTPAPATDSFNRVSVNSMPGVGIGIVIFFWETALVDDVEYFEFAPAPVQRFYSYHIYFQGVKRFKNEECPA
jgi:hypothetical protein